MSLPETAKASRVGPAPHIAITRMGAGPFVLFLHGIGGNRTNWHHQLPSFATAYTAVACDARGYGDSDDYDGPLAFGAFSDDVIRVLDHLGCDQAWLVGLSMGGRIALDCYGRYPERVAGLVLADTSVARRGPEKREQDEAALADRKRPLVVEGKTPADIAPGIAARLAAPDVSPAARTEIIASMAALRTESYLKTLEAVVWYEAFPELSAVQVPCLVLAGEHDPLATPDLCDRMAEDIPDASHAMIAGSGHFSNIEQPEAFNAAVLNFLGKQVGHG